MFTIFEGARLLREMASAIRSQDLPAILAIIKTIAEKAGFGPEVDAITRIANAIQGGPDWGELLNGLIDFLTLLSGHLNTQVAVMSADDVEPETLARKLEAEADELDQRTIDQQAVGTPQLDPATLIMLVQLVIQAVRWWRDRQ